MYLEQSQHLLHVSAKNAEDTEFAHRGDEQRVPTPVAGHTTNMTRVQHAITAPRILIDKETCCWHCPEPRRLE